MAAKGKKIFNPFEGQDSEQVWKEIRKQARPITREEALRKLKGLSDQKKK